MMKAQTVWINSLVQESFSMQIQYIHQAKTNAKLNHIVAVKCLSMDMWMIIIAMVIKLLVLQMIIALI